MAGEGRILKQVNSQEQRQFVPALRCELDLQQDQYHIPAQIRCLSSSVEDLSVHGSVTAMGICFTPAFTGNGLFSGGTWELGVTLVESSIALSSRPSTVEVKSTGN